ncbi:MAG TPA: LTA synthase family protein [Chthoniobacterales bacterium]|nr:LTA synthase family protein [Chthoniobacterales bacterium]
MVLWLSLVVLFVAFRATLLFIFRAELSPQPNAAAFLRLFETGLRSDTCVAIWAVLPSLILTLVGFFRPLGILHQRIRRLTIAIILSLCAIVFVADVAYFAEYDSQFNHWIFGLIYDDRRAILTTIWKTYPVIPLVLISGITVVVSAWGLNKLCRVAASADVPIFVGTKWARAITVILIVTWALTGSRVWPHYHLATVKNAAGTGHMFLNKVVLNPFFALRYAIWQERNMQKVAGLRTILRNGDVRAAAAALFPEAKNAANLDDCLKRVAPGPAGPPPTHIFLVVMESYDAWAMQTEYAALHLTDRLSALGREGIHVRGFISSGGGTMASLGALIAGLPAAGVLVNYQPVVREGVPTATAGIFKRLGYRTRFFCGASLGWERSGEFCREQGFEEVYGGDQMRARSTGNEWGVDDEDLFRFVLEHTGPERTFNLIMTSSYHAPYSVDVEKKGFDPKVLKANPICAGLSERQVRILGHLWYSDKCVAEFVSEGEREFERPLFAITGDHYSRKKFVSVHPTHTLYDQLAVPLIIYGHKALEKVRAPATLAGSHLDVLPTLIDLAAPSGFIYHAFGRDLLDESQRQVGYGCSAVIGPDFIFKIHDPAYVEDLHGQPVTSVDGKALALRYRQLHGLGWWRAMKGNQWPATNAAATPTGN